LRPDVGVVVVAAGKGERLGGSVPKQFRPIAGVPMLLRTVRPFLSHPEVREVIAVLPAEHTATPPEWLGALAGERLRVVAGGSTRLESVRRGVAVLDPQSSVVLVHDGARPFPDREVMDAVITIARGGGSAIAAVPLSDTLKEARGESPPLIARTIPRDRLWRAQTPQGFPRPVLDRALEHAGASGQAATDEAQLLEFVGEPVQLVRDSAFNLKITTEDDLRLADVMATGLR
jgi:2-C-methyl-D-erythritol 4-phosphate cytidylyltransferase